MIISFETKNITNDIIKNYIKFPLTSRITTCEKFKAVELSCRICTLARRIFIFRGVKKYWVCQSDLNFAYVWPTTEFMWCDQVRVSLKTTPRFLALDTIAMGSLFNTMFNSWVCKDRLFLINRHFDLLGFRLRPFAVAHWCTLDKSWLNLATYSVNWLIWHPNINCTSSAYICMLQCDNCTGRSLIYNENSKGPRMDPCGTPLETGRNSDVLLFKKYHHCITIKLPALC